MIYIIFYISHVEIEKLTSNLKKIEKCDSGETDYTLEDDMLIVSTDDQNIGVVCFVLSASGQSVFERFVQNSI